MGNTYPYIYEEEQDVGSKTPMVASYAPPEFMGIAKDEEDEEGEGDV